MIPGTAAAMGKDGYVLLAGTAQDKQKTFAAVKLDGDGTLLWEWQVNKNPILCSDSGYILTMMSAPPVSNV